MIRCRGKVDAIVCYKECSSSVRSTIRLVCRGNVELLHPCRSYLRRRNPAENGLRLPCHSPTPCPRHSVWRSSRHGRVPALGVQIRERPEAIWAAELVGLAIYIQLWSRCFAPSYWL